MYQDQFFIVCLDQKLIVSRSIRLDLLGGGKIAGKEAHQHTVPPDAGHDVTSFKKRQIWSASPGL